MHVKPQAELWAGVSKVAPPKMLALSKSLGLRFMLLPTHQILIKAPYNAEHLNIF